MVLEEARVAWVARLVVLIRLAEEAEFEARWEGREALELKFNDVVCTLKPLLIAFTENPFTE